MFNSYPKRLQFAHELENYNCLNFLNISVIKNRDNSISTNWFRKERFLVDFLIIFLYIYHIKKIGIIKNLVDSAILLSDNKFHYDNLNTVSKLISFNNFPIQFIDKHIKKRLKEIHLKLKNNIKNFKKSLENSSNNRAPIVSIPYYGNLSDVVKRLLQKYEVKVVFRINSKFDSFITLGKDPYEIGEQSNVVYKISCNCGKCYIGQTKCPLRIRLDKHFKNFNLNEKFHNVISKHYKNHENNHDNHSFLWNNVKILHKERNRYERALLKWSL